MSEAISHLQTGQVSELQSYVDEMAAILGVSTVELAARELDALSEHLQNVYHPGQSGPSDVNFLYAMARLLPVRSYIEIGTASGFSSMAIAMALQANSLNTEVHLHCIDRKEKCLFDETKDVGFVAVAGQATVPKVRFHFHRGTDSFHAKDLVSPKANLAFIDGNHQHPWPLQDILNLMPVLEKGAWVALHDIDLPRIAGELQKMYPGETIEPRFGPQYLFQQWPGRKIDGGNIGLVEIPKDSSTLTASIERLLSLPFETPGDSESRKRKLRAALAAAMA